MQALCGKFWQYNSCCPSATACRELWAGQTVCAIFIKHAQFVNSHQRLSLVLNQSSYINRTHYFSADSVQCSASATSLLQILSEENHSGWNLWAASSNPCPVSCGSPSDSYRSVVQALAQEFCFALLVPPEITTTLSPCPADAELVATLESPPPILDWAPAPY